MTSSGWRDLPLAVIDTETTGLDPAADRIVEIAVVQLDRGIDGGLTSTWSTLVRAPIKVSDGGRREADSTRRARSRDDEVTALRRWVPPRAHAGCGGVDANPVDRSEGVGGRRPGRRARATRCNRLEGTSPHFFRHCFSDVFVDSVIRSLESAASGLRRSAAASS